jgi:hypothetical protein
MRKDMSDGSVKKILAGGSEKRPLDCITCRKENSKWPKGTIYRKDS